VPDAPELQRSQFQQFGTADPLLLVFHFFQSFRIRFSWLALGAHVLRRALTASRRRGWLAGLFCNKQAARCRSNHHFLPFFNVSSTPAPE